MIDNAKDLKEYCEKLFVSTSPHVNKDEARAGVLGYHPLALLVVALDVITSLEAQVKGMSDFVDEEMEKIHDVLCPDCVHKLLNKSGYSDDDIDAFIARTKATIDKLIEKHKDDTVGAAPDEKGET